MGAVGVREGAVGAVGVTGPVVGVGMDGADPGTHCQDSVRHSQTGLDEMLHIQELACILLCDCCVRDGPVDQPADRDS